MIVWGGFGSGTYFNTGGRYDPTSNTWTAISTSGTPTARRYHSAVWTGTEMIVWGGINSSGTYSNTGGRYNPTSNIWTAISTTGVPTARVGHTAVWTGTEMIVWGGSNTNTGGRYNPSSNIWTATSTTGALTARRNHTAVWTGMEMIVWGGYGSNGNEGTGGSYNPITDTWEDVIFSFVEIKTTTLTRMAYSASAWPNSARASHSAVWTGNAMILFGGTNTSPIADCEIITPSKFHLYSKP
jgi:N-acetylneuraminic acid mutarotase